MDLNTEVMQKKTRRTGRVTGYMTAFFKKDCRIHVIWDDGGLDSGWFYEKNFWIIGVPK